MPTAEHYRTKNSKKEKKLVEVGKKTVDKIVRGRQFSPGPLLCEEVSTRHFFLFRWVGDSVEGILGQPIANLRRNTSYPIELDSGEIVEFFGNRLLHEIIRKNELIGSRIKIVFIGFQNNTWGRPGKIYRVYKIEGVLTRSEIPQHTKPKRR